MNDLLLIERHGPVAVVTLNRPEKRNALSLDLREEMAERLSALWGDPLGPTPRGDGDEELACMVLTGAGTAFCAGMDVTQFGGDEANRRRIVEASTAAFGAMARMPLPAVAAVNGPAIAGGFALALYCDVRVASETARFGFGELPRGIPPSYAAARSTLPAALAAELCLTGRLVHAAEAADLGIVSEVVEPEALMPRALEIAEAIAAHASVARVTKRRILLDREHLFGHLFAEEERMLREALLGGPG